MGIAAPRQLSGKPGSVLSVYQTAAAVASMFVKAVGQHRKPSPETDGSEV